MGSSEKKDITAATSLDINLAKKETIITILGIFQLLSSEAWKLWPDQEQMDLFQK